MQEVYSMESGQFFWGVIGLLAFLIGQPCLSEKLRLLKGKSQYLKAMIDDEESTTRGSKRKRGCDESLWLTEGQKLLMGAELLSKRVEEVGGFLQSARFFNTVDILNHQMAEHERKAHELFRTVLPCVSDLRLGNYLPAKELVGQVAGNAMNKLEALLLENKAGRIVIYGAKGVGKTALMKCLYNFVLKLVDIFDKVFWVTSPDQFSIKHLQDAVASAIKCDLPGPDDLVARATTLANRLLSLGKSILFFDNVSEADFTLEQVGIPSPDDGNGLKLILNTSSALDSKLFDKFVPVEVDPLSEEEAYELFVHEVGLDEVSISSLDGIPKSLTEKCHGVPRQILDIAMRMCGISDPHEWRNALYESETLGAVDKPPLQVIIDETGTKKQKI